MCLVPKRADEMNQNKLLLDKMSLDYLTWPLSYLRF